MKFVGILVLFTLISCAVVMVISFYIVVVLSFKLEDYFKF